MWAGACTSQAGTQMQTAAQAWVVLDLAQGDSFWLGVDQFLGQIPIVLFALLAGVFADRHDRRKILLSSQFTQMSCAFVMAALAFSGRIEIWHILILSFIVGSGQAFGGPSYSALIPTLVPKEHLPNAIALNSIQFNLARVVGPTMAGIALTVFGAALCFFLNGLSFVAVILSLFIISVNYIPKKTSEPLGESMKAGFRFLSNAGMKPLIALAFLTTLLGFQTIAFVPVFARDVFQGGETLYTFMLSSSGAGAVTGALLVAAIGTRKNLGRLALLAEATLGLTIIGFAWAPNPVVACVMIFLAGIALMAVFSMLTSLVQLITPDDMRGRVLSVYNLSLRGGGPVGALIAGYLINIYGAPDVIGTAGILMICLSAYFLVINRRVASL